MAKKKGKKLTGKKKQEFLRRMAAGRRKAARSSAPKARRSTGGRKTTKAIAIRNLGKARAARRANKAAGKRHPVKAYSYHRPPARVRVPAHMSYEGQTPAQRRASLRNLAKARAARRRGGHHHRAAEHSRKKNGAGRKRPHYAMSNPLGGVELIVGGFTGLLGFFSADFVDRVLATHALTDKRTKDAAGNELYADTPPTSGSYTGLYNATAIAAPMNVVRWLAGGLITVVPITIGHYVKSNVGRSSLQMFGFAAGIRIFGKALIDLAAFLTKKNGFGQRLYDGEMRASALQTTGQGATPTVPLTSLPSAGLGGVPKQGQDFGCACTPKPQNQQAPAGTGWPSYPREIVNQSTSPGGTTAPTPTTQALPPPPPPPPAPPAPAQEALVGVPRASARNPYLWGEKAA